MQGQPVMPMPPMSGQQGQPMPLTPGQHGQPMPGQQMPPMPGQQMPPMPGQQMPPMPGQQGQPMPPTPGQHGQPMPGQQMPPMPGQQMPPMPGQQGQPMPPMPGQQMPPMPGQQMPPMPGQQMPPMPGQQMPPMPGQQGQPMPPMPGQQMPPMPGQHGQPMPPTGQQSQPPNNRPPAQASPPMKAEEATQMHVVTLTRANSNSSRLMNNDSIPRASIERREKTPVTARLGHIKLCPSSFIQGTTTVLPATPAKFEQLHFPTGLVIHPLAQSESEVPLVNFAERQGCPLVRCRRCRAYINPFVQFTNGGRKWQCSLCRALTDVPAPYLCQTDPQTGLRTDVLTRPELCNALCDFVAPADYMVRPPQRPTFVFLLDVSYNAVATGMLRQQCLGIREALSDMLNVSEEQPDAEHPVDSMQVAFVAFDSNVHLFSFKTGSASARMIVVPDIASETTSIDEATGQLLPLELPAPLSDLLIPVRDSFAAVEHLLEGLPGMFAKTANVEVAFGPALSTAMTIGGPSGGKIVASVSACPSVGEGRLSHRAYASLRGQPGEHKLLVPAIEWYKQRALACSQSHLSVDLFVNGQVQVDLASIAPLAKLTSGHIIRVKEANVSKLHQDYRRVLERDSGFEAVLRIRTPPQLGAINFFGHFYVRGNDLLTLPVCDEDMSYAVQLNMQQQLSGPVFIQCALLYTTRLRERRVRVMTYMFESTQSQPTVYNNTNEFATAALMCKAAADQSSHQPFQTTQTQTADKLVKGLRMFRTYAKTDGRHPAGTGQLVLPPSLMLVPQFINGFARLAACRFSTVMDTPPDERVESAATVLSCHLSGLLSRLAPTVHCLFSPRRTLEGLPCQEMCSIEALKSDGIYLLDFGDIRCVWYGRSAPEVALRAFGITRPVGMLTSPTTASAETALLSEDDLLEVVERYTSLLEREEALSNRAHHVAVHHVPQGSGARGAPVAGGLLLTEQSILQQFPEEDVKEIASYGAFLSFLQRRAASAE